MVITYNGATFNNCTCNYSDGEFYSPDKPITITANSGYQFIGEFGFSYAYLGYRGKFINEGKRLYCDKDLSTAISISLDENYSATVTPVEPVEPHEPYIVLESFLAFFSPGLPSVDLIIPVTSE